MRFTRSMIVAFALATMIAGCGKSSEVTNVTPQLDNTAPSAPQGLMLSSDPASGNSSLRWALSSSSDVTTYEVYVFSPDPNRDNAYVLLGQTNANSPNFVLDAVGQQTSNHYRIRAVDASGNRSAFSTTLSAELRPAPRNSNPANQNNPGNNGTIEP